MSKPWICNDGRIYCPVDDYTCPYYYGDGICTLGHPEEECNDFYSMWEDEIEAERSSREMMMSAGWW